MKLRIDRKRWLRGTGQGRLMDADQQMCCLGFLAKACGFTQAQIQFVGLPTEVTDDALKNRAVWARMGVACPTRRTVVNKLKLPMLECVFADINDEPRITAKRRETLLTKEFAKIGVEVTFTGGDAPAARR